MKGGEHLYVIQSDVTGNIKVGRSSEPRRRLKQLQTGSPHRLRLLIVAVDAGFREREMHKRMKEKRARADGEWFTVGALTELPPSMYGQLDLETEDWWKR